MKNSMSLTFGAKSVNEGFARSVVASFCLQLNPTIEQLNDIKTVVSEAVTNCIVHAYDKKEGEVTIRAQIDGNTLILEIVDTGAGIDDIDQALQPMFTTRPDEDRSGMGFTIMEAFSDSLTVSKNSPSGTVVRITKNFNVK